ncbi:MAG: hypothetical protein ACFBSC_00305 [Microcoleaceae cyanobacterium]
MMNITSINHRSSQGKQNDIYDTLTSSSMSDQDVFVVGDGYSGLGYARITDFDFISFANETEYDLIDLQGSFNPGNVTLNLVGGDTQITSSTGDSLAVVENVDLTTLQNVHLI